MLLVCLDAGTKTTSLVAMFWFAWFGHHKHGCKCPNVSSWKYLVCFLSCFAFCRVVFGGFLPLMSHVVSLFQMFKWNSSLWSGNGNNINTEILWLGKPCDDAINFYIFKSYNYWEETSQKQKFPSQPQRQIMPPTHQIKSKSSQNPTPVLFFSTILRWHTVTYSHDNNTWTS